MAITELKKTRIKKAHTDRGGSDTRYRILCRHIKATNHLCPKDYTFYLAYCVSHNIEPVEVVKDKGTPPILYDGRSDKQNRNKQDRYSKIMEVLYNGMSITQADYGFLWKFCKANGLEMPWCRASYSLVRELG